MRGRKNSSEAIEGNPTVVVESSTLPADPDAGGTEEAVLDAVTVDGELPKASPKEKYWIGTLSSCPFSVVIVDGEDFPRITEDLPDDPLDTSRYPRLGKVIELSEDRVARITARIKELALRILNTDKNGKISDARILDTTQPSYKRETFDAPLAAYLYMVRVTERMPSNWREKEPPSMLRQQGASGR